MLKAIFNFFKKPVAPVAETPYKVEAPTPVIKPKKPTVKKATSKPAPRAKSANKPKTKKAE